MKFGLKLFVATLALSSSQLAFSQDDLSNITAEINRNGVTECNGLIRENLKIGQNWFLNFTRFSDDLGSQVELVTVNSMYGTYGDSVKAQQTYIQTPEKCALIEVGTITYTTTCQEVIESNWTRSSVASGTDYVIYTTPTGVEVYLKSGNASNEVSCVAEFQRRITQAR